jgi:hypothetical protein
VSQLFQVPRRKPLERTHHVNQELEERWFIICPVWTTIFLQPGRRNMRASSSPRGHPKAKEAHRFSEAATFSNEPCYGVLYENMMCLAA